MDAPSDSVRRKIQDLIRYSRLVSLTPPRSIIMLVTFVGYRPTSTSSPKPGPWISIKKISHMTWRRIRSVHIGVILFSSFGILNPLLATKVRPLEWPFGPDFQSVLVGNLLPIPWVLSCRYHEAWVTFGKAPVLVFVIYCFTTTHREHRGKNLVLLSPTYPSPCISLSPQTLKQHWLGNCPGIGWTSNLTLRPLKLNTDSVDRAYLNPTLKQLKPNCPNGPVDKALGSSGNPDGPACLPPWKMSEACV